MDKVLSQEEIDALLAGLEGGEVDTTPEPSTEEGVRPFDFRHYSVSTRIKIPGFEVINEHLARGLRMGFSTLLREIVEVNSEPIQMERFRDFLNRIPVPTSIHIFRLEPLRGQALLVIDAPLVFTFVERFLGGGERKLIKVEGREFTPIEQRLIRRVVNHIFQELERAWKGIQPVKAKYVRGEVNPQFARVLQPEEIVVVCNFEVDIEGITGKIAFCYSFGMLQPIKSKLYTPYQVEETTDPYWQKQLEEIVFSAEVNLKAFLGHARLKIRDLLSLEPGDVLVLEEKAEEPVTVSVEGIPKIKGELGSYRRYKAIKVLEFIRIKE
ncbi:flagellar motor switch protein FliM [Thermosulfurimonas sp.]|uniref:flagellar motor switch protein FliM n=1 Tax=Thermosulfurimonas sp. TaxID=2080236 RepID=UPI0025F101FA|nr:flagellar motor switch protein FliM [Thermosulfurimonas sp.]